MSERRHPSSCDSDMQAVQGFLTFASSHSFIFEQKRTIPILLYVYSNTFFQHGNNVGLFSETRFPYL